MARPETKMTYDDFRRLPEGPPYYELIGGELLLSPAPTIKHHTIVSNLYVALRSFAKTRVLGKAYIAPVDVVLSDEDVVEPDVFFVAGDRLDLVQDDGVHGPPDFVMEALSPSDPRRDRKRKRDLYERFGVREYWIADPEQQVIEVLLHDGARFNSAGTFRPGDRIESRVLAGFEVDVSDLFNPEP